MRAGLIKKEEIPNGLPSGMQGFAYNLRRPLFQDPRVREALAYAFDFEWSNKNLFYGAYKRTRSYFDNSELAATGVPQGEELKILEKYRGQIPDQVFTTEYDPPKYDGSGNIRDGVRAALKLLKEAGWTFKGEKLVNDETGQPFEFEILLDNPQFERIVLPFAKNLERMGITARVRTIDNAQYQKRMETFDYDMAVVAFGESLSPGNEQRDDWGSQSADEQGSRNLMGIKSKVVDELIEELVRAPDRASLVAHTHALDRVLPVRLLPGPALPHRGVPRCPLGQVPPPRGLAEIRGRTRDLVDRPRRRAVGRGQERRSDKAVTFPHPQSLRLSPPSPAVRERSYTGLMRRKPLARTAGEATCRAQRGG